MGGTTRPKADPPTRVRQDGWLKAPAAGRYSFAAKAAGGARVWLDGTLVIDGKDPGLGTRWPEVELTGRPQAVRVEHQEGDLAPSCVLFWEPLPRSRTGGVPVTAAHLFRDRAAAERAAVPPLVQAP